MATVAIVGAGIAGLSAARALVADGHEATVFERATHPGGRVATRFIGGVELPRIGTVDLAFDHELGFGGDIEVAGDRFRQLHR